MSEETVFKSPKKRILTDSTSVHNNTVASKKNKVSLEFEMVNIHSKIPQPIDKPNLNRDPSNIPTAPLISPSKSLQDIKQIMALKQKLSHRKKLTVPIVKPPKIEPPVTSDLYDQIDSLTEVLDNLKEEIKSLNRNSTKLDIKIDEAKRDLQSSNWKFQAKEDLIMKNVLHKEQMINLQIKQHETKLTDQFNEIKFQLQNELEQARAYEDKDILQEIKALEDRVNSLEKELHECNLKRQAELDSEQSNFDNLLLEKLQPKYNELNDLQQVLADKKNTSDQVETKIKTVRQQIEEKKQHLQHLAKAIEQLDLVISNFSTSKAILLVEINSIDNEVREINLQKNEWDSKYQDSLQLNLQAQTKLNKYNLHRQIVENSIMDFQGKLRVYILNATNCYLNQLEIDTKSFVFNKVFPKGYANITDEFSCLIKSCVKGNNVSVIFSGAKLIVTESIINSCKTIVNALPVNEQFDLKFKSLFISDNATVDALNSANEVISSQFSDNLSHIQCQQMEIDTNNYEPFRSILTGLENNKAGTRVHIVTLKTSKLESSIVSLDISSQSMEIQLSQLNSFISINTGITRAINLQQKIMKYSYLHSKCLFLTDMSSIDSIDLPNIMGKLHLLNCPYKRKH